MAISLLQIHEDGSSSRLAELDDNLVYIGRDPPDGIVVESKAVSREHGAFLYIANQWFYKDLGSSNGSWINGKPASAGIPYMLRPSDSIQLADVLLLVAGEYSEVEEMPSVIVFSRGDFHSNFPVPEVGKIVSVGGTKGDLKLDTDFEELPVLVLEKRSNFICVFPVGTKITGLLNDHPLTQLTQLKDRDIVNVTQYSLMVSTPSPDSLDSVSAKNLAKSREIRQTFTGWEEVEKAAPRAVFGQFGGSAVEGSVDDDRTPVAMRPSGRFIEEAPKDSDIATVVEEKIVFVLGFIMILVILVLVFWWIIG